MRATRGITALGLTLSAAVLLSACSGSTDTDGADDTTVTVGLTLEPTSLDIRHVSGAALDQILIDNVYEGLVSRTADGEIVDTLAKSHEISDDGLSYTFTLNDGVTFHDGAELTADDVVWSLEQVKDDESVSDHDLFADVSSIEATDDSTVVITLGSVDSNFLWNLTGRAGLILEEAADNDLATTANGTGPYTLENWKQGDSITFARYDDYWGQKAQVAGVDFVYITDASSAVNAAVAGDLDVLTPVDATLKDQLDGTDFDQVTGKTTDKYTLAFNNAAAPLDDVRVREALQLAVDHAALIDALGGAATEMGGPIPELDPGYEDLTDLRPYDQEKAKDLLAEAGQSDLELTLTVPNIYGTTVSNFLVSAYKEVGVTLTVDSVEFQTWLDTVYTNHDYQLSFVDHTEARDFANWTTAAGYYFGYSNPDVDALYAESVAATDADTAADKLKEAARIVAEDHAADWLYNATSITAVRSGVTGFPTDSTNSRLDLGELAVSD